MNRSPLHTARPTAAPTTTARARQGWQDRLYWLHHATETDLLQCDVPLTRAEEEFRARCECQEDYWDDHR